MALVVKTLPVNAGDVRDMGLIPGSGKSPGGGHDNSLQYFCLENPMDRGAWWATVQRVTKNQTQWKRLSTHVYTAKYVYLLPLLLFRFYLPDTSSTTLFITVYLLYYIISCYLFLAVLALRCCCLGFYTSCSFTLVVALSRCGVWASLCRAQALGPVGLQELLCVVA